MYIRATCLILRFRLYYYDYVLYYICTYSSDIINSLSFLVVKYRAYCLCPLFPKDSALAIVSYRVWSWLPHLDG